MDESYGQRISGIFGYTHQTGGYDGGQAEFVRVPIADFNCLKVPDDMPDEKVLFLSDIVCTSWFGNELAEVKEGNTVAVWGCGPVGLLSLQWAKFRGAKRIIALDSIQYRLDKAKELGAHVINIETESDVVGAILKIKKKGPHCCIDCIGWHPRKEALPKSPEKSCETNMALNQAMDCARKTGRIAVIGDYFGYVDHFHIGALAIKALQMKSGQVPVHRFWGQLLELIRKGKFDPTFVITHRFPFEKAEEAYKIFDNREQNVLKIILKMEGNQSLP
jgi:threonine dehydrogenase-like Zn-dependent dehydrogenase